VESARFQVLTAVTLNITLFSDMMSSGSEDVSDELVASTFRAERNAIVQNMVLLGSGSHSGNKSERKSENVRGHCKDRIKRAGSGEMLVLCDQCVIPGGHETRAKETLAPGT
jgi:hypothetical protein